MAKCPDILNCGLGQTWRAPALYGWMVLVLTWWVVGGWPGAWLLWGAAWTVGAGWHLLLNGLLSA